MTTQPTPSLGEGNVSTGNVSNSKLSSPGDRTAIKNNQIIFYEAGTEKFDVYDIATDSWSIGVLPVKLLYPLLFP